MMVLPLGITFTAILMSVSAETRTKIMMGVFLSFLIVAMDCIFFFAKNSFIAYNCDGGLLLSFASLFFFAIIGFIRFDDRAAKVGNIFLAFFMLSAFMGIAYWDRPTFIPTSDYTAEEIAAMNMKYQDYIASFQNGEGGQIQPGVAAYPTHRAHAAQANKSNNDKDLSRLGSYLIDAETVIKRMYDITNAIDAFGTLPSNISESERETRSSQALAINNNEVVRIFSFLTGSGRVSQVILNGHVTEVFDFRSDQGTIVTSGIVRINGIRTTMVVLTVIVVVPVTHSGFFAFLVFVNAVSTSVNLLVRTVEPKRRINSLSHRDGCNRRNCSCKDFLFHRILSLYLPFDKWFWGCLC